MTSLPPKEACFRFNVRCTSPLVFAMAERDIYIYNIYIYIYIYISRSAIAKTSGDVQRTLNRKHASFGGSDVIVALRHFHQLLQCNGSISGLTRTTTEL